MVNPYRKQREKIQKSFQILGLLKPLIEDDLPLEIVEKKAGKGKLNRLIIRNIPAAKDTILPVSYELNLELTQPVIGKVENTKTVEKVILFYTLNNLYVVLVEMKESIFGIGHQAGINTIQEKFEHSIARINLLLTSYVFLERHKDVNVNYFGIVAYNNDNVPFISDDLRKTEMYKILKTETDSLWLTDIFGNEFKVKISFIQNPTKNKEEFEIDLDDFFVGDAEFENAQFNTELSLPNILK